MAARIEITDETPGYLKESGFKHWWIRTPAGLVASAIRGEHGKPWEVFGPYDDQSVIAGSQLWTNTEIITHLVALLRNAANFDVAACDQYDADLHEQKVLDDVARHEREMEV